jgi:hypothetical protein
MKNDVLLTVVSLLTIVLLTLHLTDDFLHLEPPGRTGTLIVVTFLAAFLYDTVELAGQRSGYIITLLTSIAGVGMLVIHGMAAGTMRWGFFFVWTLVALGVTGAFGLILSAQGLWRLKKRGSPSPKEILFLLTLCSN